MLFQRGGDSGTDWAATLYFASATSKSFRTQEIINVLNKNDSLILLSLSLSLLLFVNCAFVFVRFVIVIVFVFVIVIVFVFVFVFTGPDVTASYCRLPELLWSFLAQKQALCPDAQRLPAYS